VLLDLQGITVDDLLRGDIDVYPRDNATCYPVSKLPGQQPVLLFSAKAAGAFEVKLVLPPLDAKGACRPVKGVVHVVSPAGVPTVMILAEPPAIKSGGTATLRIRSTGATSASIPGINEVPLNGEVSVKPAATTTYEITVRGPGGQATGSATVTVEPPLLPSNVTVTAMASPNPVNAGQPTVVSGVATPKTATVTVAGETATVNSATGVYAHTFIPPKTDTYLVTATDAGGTTSQQVAIRVLPPFTATGLHALIVEETKSRAQLSQERLALLLGRAPGTLRDWLEKKCVREGGLPAFRFVDTDDALDRDFPVWQAAGKAPRPPLPCIIATDGDRSLVGELSVDVVSQLTKIWGASGGAVTHARPAEVALSRKVYGASNLAEIPPAPPGQGMGRKPRREHRFFAAAGSVPGTRRFADVLKVIPRSEWSARIKMMDEKWAWPSDYCDFRPRAQGNTNFCWANAPCAAVDVVRRQMGLPFSETSAASIACRITEFRNDGGWGIDALKYLIYQGASSSKLWPNTAISREYDNALSDADRPNRKVLEWIELEKHNFAQVATALLLGYPVEVGYDRFPGSDLGHEVCAVRLIEDTPGRFGILIRNSWGDWGDSNRWGQKGFLALDEAMGTPDDAFLLRQVTAAPATSP
jgi:hypothetical protein